MEWVGQLRPHGKPGLFGDLMLVAFQGRCYGILFECPPPRRVEDGPHLFNFGCESWRDARAADDLDMARFRDNSSKPIGRLLNEKSLVLKSEVECDRLRDNSSKPSGRLLNERSLVLKSEVECDDEICYTLHMVKRKLRPYGNGKPYRSERQASARSKTG